MSFVRQETYLKSSTMSIVHLLMSSQRRDGRKSVTTSSLRDWPSFMEATVLHIRSYRATLSVSWGIVFVRAAAIDSVVSPVLNLRTSHTDQSISPRTGCSWME